MKLTSYLYMTKRLYIAFVSIRLTGHISIIRSPNQFFVSRFALIFTESLSISHSQPRFGLLVAFKKIFSLPPADGSVSDKRSGQVSPSRKVFEGYA